MRPSSALLTAASLWPLSTGAAQVPTVRVTLVDTAVITAPRLSESSGVAPSRRAGVYWTHNDSGDGPFLYAIDSAGGYLGAVRVTGAGAVDWEDLARGPCSAPSGTCLYIGDIGDNRSRRPFVVIYIVADPDPPSGGADTPRTAVPIDSVRLRYPDHAHDAEALAVTPDRQLLVITKDLRAPARLFSAPIVGHGGEPVVLTAVCTLQLHISAARGRVVTGAAVSPDGRWLVARTYVSLHVFALDGACTPLLTEDGIPIPVVETQGEAVAFEDAHHLVLTSERGANGHAILSRLRIDGLPDR